MKENIIIFAGLAAVVVGVVLGFVLATPRRLRGSVDSQFQNWRR